MPRYLIIAARNRRDLCSYLSRQFSGDETIHVLMDRRCGDRRRRWGTHTPERRLRDRRAGLHADNPLYYLGLLVVPQLQDTQGQSLHCMTGMPTESPAPEGSGKTESRMDRSSPEAARRWIVEGQRQLGLLPDLLRGGGPWEARLGALEKAVATLDQAVRRLEAVFATIRQEPAQSAGGMKRLAEGIPQPKSGAPTRARGTALKSILEP
jgi:hypothetical protein